MYKRVLLKLSGESISADDFPYSAEKLDDLADQIRQIKDMGVQIGIVIGGGNICRGKLFEKLGFERVQSDYAGMLGTVINSLMLSAKLNQIGIKTTVMSAIQAESVPMFDKDEANRLLDEGEIVIFGGGVGKPYHSTDTGSAQRAIDIGADVILMAKSGVDGVYDSDPDTNPDAKRFDELTFDDILNLELKVIDLQAAELCRDAGIGAFVFSMSGKDNIVKAVKGETTGTVIKC